MGITRPPAYSHISYYTYRYSIVFLVGCNYDSVLDPLVPGETQKYEKMQTCTVQTHSRVHTHTPTRPPALSISPSLPLSISLSNPLESLWR